MSAVVRLLGAPTVETDGAPGPAPRGRKTWGLLAYLVLTDLPPSRQRLATMLFADADDPLAALRWTLADLRRILTPFAQVHGDPVRLDLDPGVEVDVDRLRGDFRAHGWPTGDLLEGLAFDHCPAFDAWLQIERLRVASSVEALLREGALRRLGAGDTAAALTAATELISRNPLDEAHHVLLVRALAVSGSHQAALDQVGRSTLLLRTELGTDPSPALLAAAGATPRGAGRAGTLGRAAAAAQLEAGQAAVNAGAVEAGLQCLRRAVTEADAAHEPELRLTALTALGSALVHSVRGRDEEGAAVLHRALAAAEAIGNGHAAGRVCRELGFVDIQAGRGARAEQWLARAESLVSTDVELAAVLGNRGMNQSDQADYPRALASLEHSVDRARAGHATRQAAWSLSLVGRVHLLRGDSDEAVRATDQSLALVREVEWTAFAPWPESLRAELDRVDGNRDAAETRYARAFALACQIADPCWEGVAARGIGLLRADSGDVPGAIEWLTDATDRCLRWSDAYQWVHAYVRDAICDVAVAARLPQADAWVAGLAGIAARGTMREFTVRALLQRARLGQPGAAVAAQAAVADIDNPLLADLVTQV